MALQVCTQIACRIHHAPSRMSAGVRVSESGSTSVTLGANVANETHLKSDTLLTTSHRWSRLSIPVGDMPSVARDGTQTFSEQMFRQQVAAWRTAFSQCSATAVALHEPAGFEFSAMLVGAWYAEKTVYLPGDTQPGTCRALAELNVAFAGRFPEESGLQTVSAHAVATTAAVMPDAFQPLDADAARLVIFTSGSTGAPQAVPKRLAQLLSEVQTLEAQFGSQFAADDVVVATVSHQHIYGLLFKILWPLFRHRMFESESVLYPEQLATLLAARRSVVISGPAHLKRLPDTLDWAHGRSNVRAVFSSGGPLPIEAVAKAETLLGVAPVEVYGSTETGGIAWRQRTDCVETEWAPLPNVEVRAHSGRLAVRSPHLSTADWYVVEDHAELDASGRFVLKGRADRIAKIEGKRISLAAMEDALLQTGLVAEVRLVQLESSRDEIAAAVIPNEHGWTTLREHSDQALRGLLSDALRDRVERIARPRRWRWLDALPANAAGKTTNASIAALFQPAGLTGPALHVLAASSTEIQAELYVSPHLPVFDGHFRDIPVLPGVAQLDWAAMFGQRLFGIATPFTRAEALKFHRVYQPGPLLSLSMTWNAERRLLVFRYDSSTASHSSGRIFFAA
jgi:acyl-CoA synthetase (AMP-forming)/AMP-acid ligase II